MSELVTQHIPNLIGGVSEAAPSLRLSTQCEEQENCRNDVVEGMGKRPNVLTNFQFGLGVAGNGISVPEEYQWFNLYRDEEENYKVCVNKDELRVFDALSGTEYPVTYSAVSNGLVDQTEHEKRLRDYFRNSGLISPDRNFKLLQSFDTSFVLNKSVPVRPILEPVGIAPEITDQKRYTLAFSKHWSKRQTYSRTYGTRESPYTVTYTARYVFIANGTTYYYDDITKPIETVVRWAYDQIKAEYPSLTVIQNGDSIDVVAGSGVTCSFGGYQELTGRLDDNSVHHTRRKDFFREHLFKDTVANYTPSVPGALWYIKQADYKTTYRIELDDTECSIETPEATADLARDGLKTTNLTADMAVAINNLQGTHGCSAQQYGNVLFISKLDGSDFTISSSDDLGSKASYAIKSYVTEFEELPPEAPEGFEVEVRGNPETEVDPYYVIFTKFDENSGNTGGIWKETRKYGIDYRLDPYSMPVRLVRKQNATVTASNPSGIGFEIDTFDWGERTVGDGDTAPYPSFVSDVDDRGRLTYARTIKDITIHKNRLVCATEENLVMSEAGEFLNFFPTTVITVLDADPIDVALNFNTVNPIEHILDASGMLFLFSPDRQMQLEYEGVLSVKSVDVKVLTSYQMDMTVAPFVVGDSIYFWQKEHDKNHLMEFYQYSTEGLWTARPVTQHVPKYVKGQPIKSVASPANNTIVTLCRGEDGENENFLYIYNYFKEDNKLTQSAWQKWTFSSEVLDITIREGELTMVTKRPFGFMGVDSRLHTYCERIVFKGQTEAETELGHRLYLDSIEEVDVNYTVDPELNDERVIKTYNGRYFVGFPYTQLYKFTELFARENDKVLSRGRLQIGHIFLNFTDTTEFTVRVERTTRETRDILFSGRVLGSISNLLGVIPQHDGQKSIPIHAKSAATTITILNDTPQDAVFQTADWEGTFTRRARRI